jgi:hypothetical protein
LKLDSQHFPVDLLLLAAKNLHSRLIRVISPMRGLSQAALLLAALTVPKNAMMQRTALMLLVAQERGVNEQAVQLQTSGTVTADGFPAAFSGAGADAEQRATTVARNEEIEALLRQEAEIAAKLEQLRLQEAQLRRSQNNI